MDCRVTYEALRAVFEEEPELLEWLIQNKTPDFLAGLNRQVAEEPFRGVELPDQVRLMREVAEAQKKG